VVRCASVYTGKERFRRSFMRLTGFLPKAIVTFAVLTENSVGAENAEGPIVRVIMVATMMSSLFTAFLRLLPPVSDPWRATDRDSRASSPTRGCPKERAASLPPPPHRPTVVLSRFWSDWRYSLQIVQPDTVIRWHRRAFGWYWTRESPRHPGNPRWLPKFVTCFGA
jgi:hypothetical protein